MDSRISLEGAIKATENGITTLNSALEYERQKLYRVQQRIAAIQKELYLRGELLTALKCLQEAMPSGETLTMFVPVEDPVSKPRESERTVAAFSREVRELNEYLSRHPSDRTPTITQFLTSLHHILCAENA